jgi:MFS family permease
MPLGRDGRILAAAMLATGAIFVDLSVLSVVLPGLRDDLGTTLAQEQWIVNAYFIATVALVLPCGVIGDIYGHRRLLRLGILVFVVATLLVAIAPDPLLAIGARALVGVGAAMITPSSVAILRTAIAPERRVRAIGLWATGTALSSAIGPVLGGLVSGLVGWRWAFLVVVPALLAALVLARAIPANARADRRIDVVGGVLVALAAGLLVAALIEVPGIGATHPRVLLPAAGGVLAAALLILHERRFPDPIIPPRAVRDRLLNRVHLYTLLAWSVPTTLLLLLSIQLQTRGGVGAIATGLLLAPTSLAIALLSPRLTRIAADGRMRAMMRVGPLLTASSTLPAAFIAPGRVWLGLVAALILGLGMACLAAPVTHAVLHLSPPGDEGMQSAINLAAARTGSLLSVALLGIAAAAGWAVAGGGAVPANPLQEAGVLGDAAYRGALVLIAALALLAVPLATSAVRPAGEASSGSGR